MSIYTSAQGKYNLHIRGAEKDTALLIPRLGLQTSFTSQIACSEYISKLTGILQSKGYATASIDSIRYDSSDAYMVLFAGERYLWARIDAKNIDPSILDGVGWRDKVFMNKPMDFSQLQEWQEKLLKYLENNGYPFSKIYLDSLQLDNEMVSAQFVFLVMPRSQTVISSDILIFPMVVYTIKKNCCVSIRKCGSSRM